MVKAAALAAVRDHVNLTWSSPLRGRNDDSLGPRFPVTADLYRPGDVLSRLGKGVPVEVAACVRAEGRLNALESEVISHHGLAVITSELAPVALLAAHLGYALAAVVLDQGKEAAWR
jgi:hypothetical protein